MSSLVEALGDRIVGAVEEVSADEISVLLDSDAPQATAINTGAPSGFPRINGYLLVPNEVGATVGWITSVKIVRLPYPKRKGMQDFGLVDLPFPSRIAVLAPLGTLAYRSGGGTELSFEVRRGVDIFPSVGDPVLLPTLEQLRAIVEGERKETSSRILLGQCPTAGGADVHVDPDKLFGRHLAVLGNTGAGKSCTVAGLLRWSMEAAKKHRLEAGRDDVPNARFIVLDPNGEYAHAFADLGIRLFQVEPVVGEGSALKVPAWLWNGEEWAAFTGASPGVQRPILFEALRRLRSGYDSPDPFETKVRGRVRRYRNRLKVLVANGDHQATGRREGVAQVLLNVAADFEDITQDSACVDTSLKENLIAVIRTANEVEETARSNYAQGKQWHNNFTETALGTVQQVLADVAERIGLSEGEEVIGEDVPCYFALNELPDFVEALASDSSGRDLAQFVDSLNLRIRGLIGRGGLAPILHPEDSASIRLEDWLANHIGADNAANGQIAVIDLSLVPSEVIHVVVAVLARLTLEALQRYRRQNGNDLPTVLVLEEAHTFVHENLTAEGAPPAGRACCRVFERIAREGRKFGLGLLLASQRPSEVSPTVLSQCNTFLLHRIVNDRDQQLVRRLVPDGLGSLLRELPSLPSRRAILLGWAAPAPILVEILELPESRRPHSPDPAFWDVWTGDPERGQRPIDWGMISDTWIAANSEKEDRVEGTEIAGESVHESTDEDDDIPF